MWSSPSSPTAWPAKQQQGGAEPFAAQPNAVADDRVDLGMIAMELVVQAGVDAAQLGLDAGVERGERTLQVESGMAVEGRSTRRLSTDCRSTVLMGILSGGWMVAASLAVRLTR